MASTMPVGNASQMLAAVAPHVHRKSIVNATAAKAAIAVAAYAATTSNTAAAPSSAAVAAASANITHPVTSSPAPSSSHTTSNSSIVLALDPMKVWSTLTTLSGDLYTINSSLRELQLTDQHKSHALSILQSMIQLQDGKNEAFRSELQQARKDISALTTTLSKQAAAQAALASAAPEVSAGDFARLSQDFTRQLAESTRQNALLQKQSAELDQLRLVLQQTKSEHALGMAQLSAQAQAQATFDEEERLKKRAQAEQQQQGSTTSAEVDALQSQLSSLRAQQAQQIQMASNATLLQTRDIHELKNTVQILQNSLTALASSQVPAPAPAPVTVQAPPTTDPEITAHLTALQADLTKAKKQNLALREALIKLNKRMDEGKEAMETTVASLTLTMQSHAAAAAASATAPAVSIEDFAALRKSLQSSRKGLKHVEDTIEVLSSVVEATGTEQARALEKLKAEQAAMREELAQAARAAKEASEARTQELKVARESRQKEDEMMSARLEQMESDLEKKIAEVKQQMSSSGPVHTQGNSSSVSSPTTVEVVLDSSSSSAIQSLQAQFTSLQAEVHASQKSLEVTLQAAIKSATVETNVRLETEVAKIKEHIDAVHTASTDWRRSLRVISRIS